MRRFGCVAAVLALLVMAGCGAADERTRTDVITAQLRTWISNDPNVVTAEVEFLYTAVNPGDASARIEVREGTDAASIATIMVHKIWASELDPLRRINVTVSGAGPPTVVSYELPKQNAELERQFGKRPDLDGAQKFGSAILYGLIGVLTLAFLLVVGLIVLAVALVRRRRRTA